MVSALVISLMVSQGPSLNTGRGYVKQLYAGRSNELWSAATNGLKQQLGSEAALKSFIGKLEHDFGREQRVISEGLVTRGALTAYRRTAAFSSWARGVELELLLDQTGKLAGYTAQIASHEAPTPYASYQTKAHLRLPFEGQWYVLWGGRTWDENKHSAVPDQRYALDLLQLARLGGSFEGDGTKNEQYPAWGKPVLAAGDGVVVAVEDGVPDNEPNKPRVGNLFGNHVVIDHGTGEFSLVAHLQRGTVAVKPGDVVSSGQVLAKCGNSGMSTEPHIHYQLMDRADWRAAYGFPVQFHGYLSGSRVIEHGEPRRLELLTPVPLEASSKERG